MCEMVGRGYIQLVKVFYWEIKLNRITIHCTVTNRSRPDFHKNILIDIIILVRTIRQDIVVGEEIVQRNESNDVKIFSKK